MNKAMRLTNKIRLLQQELYKNRKELKKIQTQCKHVFPGFNVKKKTGKIFEVTCTKCGHHETIAKYALID